MDSGKCPKCNGIGYIITKHEKYHDFVRECDCRKAQNAKDLLRRSGISQSFKSYSFKSFLSVSEGAKYAKSKAMDYVINFDKIRASRQNSTAFLGQVGSGKTHLCMAIVNSLLERNIPVLYMPYREAITEIKQNILDEVKYLNLINKYKNAEVLYIDDLFKGKITESDINIMFEIVNYRYINNLPLIISSEFKIDRLLDFDEAIGSRIVEMAKDYLVVMDGDNYRLKGVFE
jgi:DNA replication protein DnaC